MKAHLAPAISCSHLDVEDYRLFTANTMLCSALLCSAALPLQANAEALPSNFPASGSAHRPPIS